MDASSASSAGAEISINSGVSVQSSAARTGRSGIKPAAAPPGRARAGGHSRGAPRPRMPGGAWLVLKSTIRTSLLVHHQPVDLPGNQRGVRPAVQPARDRDFGAAAGARTPARNGHPRSGPAPFAPAPRARRRSSRPALRARYPSAASRRRSAAMSGSDCSSRCTSVPRWIARARDGADSLARTR